MSDQATAIVPGLHDIETPSGRYLSLLDPDPADICVEDIAHNLSNICRFGGACTRFYSVAEHAVLVANRLAAQDCAARVVLAGLHHDDAEAYLGDIPRPLKPLLGGDYKILTDGVDRAIAEALGLARIGETARRSIKAADNWALVTEASDLLPSKGEGWHVGEEAGSPTLGRELGLPPESARDRFLRKHAYWAKRV